jgi:PAS domain S-box-containing protein
MNADLDRQIQELQAENGLLRQQLEQKTKLASRALASYQQRALQMEIIRQQNEELDRLTTGLTQAKQLAEEQAQQYSLANLALEKEVADRKQVEVTLAKRVRELKCLNEIGREIAEAPAVPDLLGWIAERIPPAMQYPGLCKVAIEYGGQVYGATEAITLPAQVVNALWVKGDALGRIYISYTEKQEFLDEESAMLGGIASQVSAYIENRRLVEQLQRHTADLEETTAILDSFIDNTPVMIFIKEAKDLKFVRWNKANESLMGLKMQDVIGKGDHDFLPKEIADFFVAKDREVFASGQLLDIPEEPVQTSTGEIRFLHTRKMPIYGADGEPKYLIGVSEDITERKRVEASLRESEQRYRQILDAITDMVLVKGPQSRIVWANKAFRDCYGMSNEQLSNLVDAPFVEPDYTQQYIKDDAHVFDTAQVLDIPEEPVTRYDGHILLVHTVKSPLFDVDGQVVGTVGVSRDITERKQIQEALAKRATEFQTVAQVSIAASTTLDVRKLLQEVVDLTKSSFNLYHAHIYLLSETGNTLHLVAGAGEVGRQMVAQGWNIPVEREHSLVAQTARTRQGVIVNDVHLNPDFLPNPLLPLTQSEMAVPMIVGNRVLGVLDVQSDRANHFTEEDIRIQTILAAQVAVALQNAQQYGQTEAALAETAWLYQISTQLSASTNIKELFDAAVTPARASGATSAALMVFQLDEAGQPEWAEVVETLEIEPKFPVGTQIYLPESPLSKFQFSEEEKVLLVGNTAQDERLVPALKDMLQESQIAASVMMTLTVGQRPIGRIVIGWDTPQLFTERDQRLYDSIATQAATIFDNQLLLEQVQRQADRERLVNTITAKIQSTTTIQNALQTAIQELGQAFQARSTQIKLGKIKEARPTRVNGI